MESVTAVLTDCQLIRDRKEACCNGGIGFSFEEARLSRILRQSKTMFNTRP